MKFRPGLSRLLVEVIKDEEPKTKSGIILNPDTVKKNQKYLKGKVLAIGNGKVNSDGKKDMPEINVNDIILFSKFAGDDVVLDNKKYTILEFKDITAIVE